MKFDAYLSNLRVFTEGNEAGDWIRLPITQQDFQQVCRCIGLDDTAEYFFPAYDTDMLGLHTVLPEFADISTLNYCAACISKLDEESFAKLEAAFLARGSSLTPSEIISLIQNLDNYSLYPDINTEEELGHYCVEELNLLHIDEETGHFFQYEKYGEAFAINNAGDFTTRGFLLRDHKAHDTEWDGVVPTQYQLKPPSPQPVKKLRHHSGPVR